MLIAAIAVGGAKIGYAYMADKVRLLFENPRLRRAMDVTAGSVMVASGIYLVAKT